MKLSSHCGCCTHEKCFKFGVKSFQPSMISPNFGHFVAPYTASLRINHDSHRCTSANFSSQSSTMRLILGHPSVSRRLIAIASTRSFAMRVFLVCYVGPSCLVQCTYESLSLAILASSPPFLSQLGNRPTAPYVLTSQLALAIVSLGTGSKYFEDKCLNLGTFFARSVGSTK